MKIYTLNFEGFMSNIEPKDVDDDYQVNNYETFKTFSAAKAELIKYLADHKVLFARALKDAHKLRKDNVQ